VYTFEVFKRDGTLRRSLTVKNMVVNAGLNALLNTANVTLNSGTCIIGTGTTAVSAADTQLSGGTTAVKVGRLNNAKTITALTDGGDYRIRSRMQFRYAVGAATGTWSEVGVGQTDGASGFNPMFSRALILDGLGNPTTISVLADEYLDVTYDVIIRPPLEDVTGSFTLAGTTYNYTLRACSVTSVSFFQEGVTTTPGTTMFPFFGTWGIEIDASVPYSTRNPANTQQQAVAIPHGVGTLVDVTSSPTTSIAISNKVASSSTFYNAAYIAGTFYTDVAYRWSPEHANFPEGIGMFVLGSGNGGRYQLMLDQPLLKTNLNELTIVLRFSIAAT
jgi:hypothetical protein